MKYAALILLMAPALLAQGRSTPSLEEGFRRPPQLAKPDTYWLWMNGYVDPPSAEKDLQALKDAGFGGVLLFDMGAGGDKAARPPAGPAFLSKEWLANLKRSAAQARSLGLAMDLSVISSWDLGGHWIEPRHASMGLYPVETTLEAAAGGGRVEALLPFPIASPAAPKGADGKPAFWRDVAILAVRDAQRRPGHELVLRLIPDQVHELKEVVLDNGTPNAAAELAAKMTPVKEFSVAVSAAGSRDEDFREVLRGTLAAEAGAQRFALPAGTRGRFVRLRLLSGRESARPHWTLAEFGLYNMAGQNVAMGRSADNTTNGAAVIHAPTPIGYDGQWSVDNFNDGSTKGAGGVFASAGLPPFAFEGPAELVDVSKHVDAEGRLRWDAPPGRWTILRFVCMNTGERLKVPSPNSDGWATDHLSAEATRAHMDYVIARLKETFGNDLRTSGLGSLYLASYEVRGPVWSPGFTAEFQRRRGYSMAPYLPAIFGARVGTEEATDRFLFDYRKTLGEVLVEAYYGAAREAAHAAGLTIKSEAGGPGPPIHNVPVDALLANKAVDEIQGEFWPWWPKVSGLWVVKEPASAGHLYAKPRVHVESFTSFEEWREGPQDIKWSADRVLVEGANHFVWHTWAHSAPEAGLPGWAYLAGTHLNRNVTWWPKVKPFAEYLGRSSFLLQQGQFVADILYYYGDGGYKFIPPRHLDPAGYDYDVANSDVILNRLTVKNGRLSVPGGPSYAVLVLPDEAGANPAVLEKIEQLVAQGATVAGPRPRQALGLEGFPESDRRVRESAARLWGAQETASGSRAHGKGRVIWGSALKDVLAGLKIAPDFTAPDPFDYIHRSTPEAEIYFVRNTTAQAVKGRAKFRVAGRAPERWNPVTAAIEDAPEYTVTADGVEVPLEFDRNGSMFVVFRRPARAGAVRKPRPPEVELAVLGGVWNVEFEKGRGAPAGVAMERLAAWTESGEEGIRFFAGSARYSKSFQFSAGQKTAGRKVFLDLGDLWTIGEAWLNGRPLGIVWTAPFRVECSGALKEGTNELVVEVTNTWYNRLVGDARLPAEKRMTRTNVVTSGQKPWAQLEPLRSGLFGPVRLVAE
ncbi:MAG: hypothetical protein HY821_25935 [Acidobacteria bacterium]|nr:hypothetical protein [Acidobacteriota bacterium]